MQYCKNCGRQLEDGIRFCDRCGKSVNQGKNSARAKKQQQIEKLQKERIERKKLREEREAEQLEKKEHSSQVRSKISKPLIIVGICVAALIVIAIVSYIVTTVSSKDEVWKTNAIGNLDATPIPTMQPSETEEPTPTPAAGSSTTYSAYILSNDMNFSYPDTYTEAKTEGDEELKFEDANGSVIKLYMKEYPGGSPSYLMGRYADTLEGTTNFSETGNDWYVLTVQRGDIVSHRKYIIDRENDLSVYYDMEFDVSQNDVGEYEEYMDYMDAKFGLVKAGKSDKKSD